MQALHEKTDRKFSDWWLQQSWFILHLSFWLEKMLQMLLNYKTHGLTCFKPERKVMISSQTADICKNIQEKSTVITVFSFLHFTQKELPFMISRLLPMSALHKSWNNCRHLRKGRHFLALYPCHVCTLAWPPIVVQGQKGALWCAKWFTDLEDINKWFIQDSGQEVPSNFKRVLRKNNSPRSISLLSHYFLSLSSVAQMAALDWNKNSYVFFFFSP